MARKPTAGKRSTSKAAKPVRKAKRDHPAKTISGAGCGGGGTAVPAVRPAKPSSLLGTRVIYCGDCLEQLKNLPGGPWT